MSQDEFQALLQFLLRAHQPLSALRRYPGENLLAIEQMVEQQNVMLNFARRALSLT